MPQASNPLGTLHLYTPAPGDPHSVAHPYVVYDPLLASGFDLVVGADGAYALTFSNHMNPSDHGGNANSRVYISIFASDVLNPVLPYSLLLVADTDHSRSSASLGFTSGQTPGATSIWVGSWWDDGTYPDSRDGVIAYFRDHPEGGSHHTVPIRIA